MRFSLLALFAITCGVAACSRLCPVQPSKPITVVGAEVKKLVPQIVQSPSRRTPTAVTPPTDEHAMGAARIEAENLPPIDP